MDFRLLGRMIAKQNPAWAAEQIATMNQLQERQADTPINSIPDAFAACCYATGNDLNLFSLGRCSQKVADFRRLFIAVVILNYDPLWFHGYVGMMRAGCRAAIADALRCHPVWISRVVDSVRFEYNNLSTFRMQVDLLIYYLGNQQLAA